MKKLTFFAVAALMLLFGFAACEGPTPTAPTIILTPSSVTITDDNLVQTVEVSGTATGAVELNSAALPDGVTATVSGTTITVTGFRPTEQDQSLVGNYTVVVTRDSVDQNLSVDVNLTTTWAAPPVFEVDSITVSVQGGGAASFTSGGGRNLQLQANVDWDDDAFPGWESLLNWRIEGTTGNITGAAVSAAGLVTATEGWGTINVVAYFDHEQITGNDESAEFAVTVVPFHLDRTSVTITDTNLTEVVTSTGVGGNFSFSPTLNAPNHGVVLTGNASANTITIQGTRPTDRGIYRTEIHNVTVGRVAAGGQAGATTQLEIIMNLTWELSFTLSAESVVIDNNNLTRVITVGGNAINEITYVVVCTKQNDLCVGLCECAEGFDINVDQSEGTITISHPLLPPGGEPKTANFALDIIREGLTRRLSVNANLTATEGEPTFTRVWHAVPAGTGDGTSRFTADIQDIAFGNGVFVAVGNGGRMAISTDNGTTWTAVADSGFGDSNNNIFGITFGNNMFVAVGQAGKMAWSNDNGQTWTAVETSTFDAIQINSIAFGRIWIEEALVNRFVAVGNSGRMAFSDDNCLTWTEVAGGTGDTWNPATPGPSTFGAMAINDITFGNGRFVAVGGRGSIAWSETGEGGSWTARRGSSNVGATPNPPGDSSFGSHPIRGIACDDNGRFVAVGNQGNTAWSTNGNNWTGVRRQNNALLWDGQGQQVNDVAFGSDRFLAVANNGLMAWTTDGAADNWTGIANGEGTATVTNPGQSTFGRNHINGVAFGNGRFVAVGQNGRIAWTE